jgi:hypothetical protein
VFVSLARTKQVTRAVTCVLCILEVSDHEICPELRLSRMLIFVVFLGYSRRMPGYYFAIGQSDILLHPSQLTIKVKLSLYLTKHHAMKACWGSGRIAPHILDLGTRLRWVVSFTTRPLYPQGKSPWYLLDRRLGGPQSRSGCGGEEKNSQPPLRIEP